MATPLTATKFLAALKAAGLTVVEHPGWKTHTRTAKGRPWGPVNGIMIHHTVTQGTDTSVRICRDGYASLPGPLCHGVIAKDGTIHLVGYGRTNHAGGGDPDTLEAVVSEDYGDNPPKPNVGNTDGTDGNRHFYGFECINMGDGEDPWPAAQLEAIAKASAALCKVHDWKEKSVIGHLEWSDDKSDPRGFSMSSMRTRVAGLLDDEVKPPVEPTKPTPPPAPKPKPEPEKPKYQPFPGTAWFKSNPNSPIVTAMGKRLVAEGCGRYNLGPGPRWTDVDRDSYRRWQRKRGFYGSAADGWPGKVSWDALKVPFVK